ncbi:hypothetical protein [Sphingobacterium hungaricum]|uniref:Uncharacterized protein n=1 Tax=Sphingobacterium hungaricum TaxID=2082723 RepID=A0A928UVZ7_9SPHI|nr:hypothetical protein [Sphingobacterium hungaricum]MBE8714250.1 hypothetical protein [Sphingobacterium hungaricum]
MKLKQNEIRKLVLILAVTAQLMGCISTRGQKMKTEDLSGTYILETDLKYKALSNDKNYSSLELHKNGTYILNKAAITFTPVIEQCTYASKGRWSVVAGNLIEITSEDHYEKQQGFEYDLKNENKLSQDSLYIQVVFPTDFHPVHLNFTFNHNNSKSIKTDKTYIVLSKSQYLRSAANQVAFSLSANFFGAPLSKSRTTFNIFFEELIDTKVNNYLTITLPNFDRCFFEFEPYNGEFIYVKNSNQLVWQGEIWQ